MQIVPCSYHSKLNLVYSKRRTNRCRSKGGLQASRMVEIACYTSLLVPTRALSVVDVARKRRLSDSERLRNIRLLQYDFPAALGEI